METVEYLMVGEETSLQVMVHITLVKGFRHWSEHYTRALLLEDTLQAVVLLG